MAPVKTLFVAATRQHVGKTTVSLALISGLKKRFKDIGFIKPVGQQHEIVESGIKVDKDVSLMKEYFQLNHCRYEDMSPVLIPPGYTRDYVDGKISESTQLEAMYNSYRAVAATSDVVVLEGTGHTAVGSIVNLNNAQVAKYLGADMILVTNGGLGSAYDELELNRCMCAEYGVKIRGVVLNKVMPGKLPMVRDYFEKLLKRWNVPLLGVVPDEPYLGRPSLMDIEKVFKTKLISGQEYRSGQHYSVQDTLMVATGLRIFLEKLETMVPDHPLVVTHCSRNDIILGFMAHVQKCKLEGVHFGGALVLTGHTNKPLPYIVRLLETARIPVIHSNLSTFHTMDAIRSYTPKLHKDDLVRVAMAVRHYEPYIDFDTLLSD